MRSKKFQLFLKRLQDSYPEIRLCNEVPYCTKERGYGEKYLKYHENAYKYYNMQMIYDMDFFRAWLYLDLAGDSKTVDQCLNWFNAYLTVDFVAWQTACDAAYELIRRDNVSAMRISEFKAHVRTRTGVAPAFLLAPIWSQVEAFFLSNEKDVNTWKGLVRKWVQWTRTGRKQRLINTSAHEAAYEKFKANDDRLQQLWSEPNEEREQICKELRAIIHEWLKPFPFRIDFPSHGSGATANELVHKNVTLKSLSALTTDEWLTFLLSKLQMPSIREDLQIPSYVAPANDLLSRAARFLTVDKNIEERRGIGPQEAALMWIQEGVRDWFYEGPFRTSYFQKHMPIFNRCVNQVHAVNGSLRNDLATIDFSSASDSVTVHLVKRIFEGDLRYALLLARSTCFDVEPDRKFTTYATMGDATTFPVETITFAACVRLAITRAVTKYHSTWSKVPFDPDLWSVFGDDVVIPNDPVALNEFYHIVKMLGFKLNEDKSFIHGPYRESCGIEAYLGSEIQPIYMRCKVDRKGSRFASLVSLANLSFEASLKHCRQWFIYLLRKEFGNVPFTEMRDDSSRVYTPNLRLDNVKIVWDKDIQEAKVLSRGVRSPLDDSSLTALNDNYGFYIKKHAMLESNSRLPSVFFYTAPGIIWFNKPEDSHRCEPVYDERLTKLCQMAVPVRLLVESTSSRR